MKRCFCLFLVLLLLIIQFGCTQGLGDTGNSSTDTQITEKAELEDTANGSGTNADISTSFNKAGGEKQRQPTVTSGGFVPASGIMEIKCIGENNEIKIVHFLEVDPPKKVIYYGIDKVEITTGSGTQDLVDAFKKGLVDEEKIFSFLDEQVKNGRGKTVLYKDGGSVQYVFDGFSVLRIKNIMSGSRDIAFIKAGKDVNNLFDFCVKPTNTTVANG